MADNKQPPNYLDCIRTLRAEREITFYEARKIVDELFIKQGWTIPK